MDLDESKLHSLEITNAMHQRVIKTILLISLIEGGKERKSA